MPDSPSDLMSEAPGFPCLCQIPCHRVTWESRCWDGPGNVILTYQDSCVLVGGVKGALAFPLHNLVLRDGQQVGISEFLGGREVGGLEHQSLTCGK